MDRINFVVTEKAGTFVAGMRSPGAGKTIPLTEEQAVYALEAGELAWPAAPAKPTRSRAEPKPVADTE